MKKKSNRLFLVICSVSIVLLSLGFFCIPVHSWEIDATGTVSYIYDGDTFNVTSEGTYTIRLADIDCPESGEPGYENASNYLESLIYQKEVYIDVDDITGTDPYGRIVAAVYVYYNESHLKNVNKALLVAGHAVIWDFDNNEFNPYEWTLYVEYPPSSPSDNPPSDDPPDNPPPEDPPPSDDTPNNNRLSPASVVVLVFGVSAIGISATLGVYAYYKLPIFKKRREKQKLKPIERYDIATQPIEKKSESTGEEILLEKPIEKDLVTTPAEDKIMIKNITFNMYHIAIDGEIKKIKMPHEFSRKDGSVGQVGSFWLSDVTGSIRVVLWDDNCYLLENGECAVGKHAKIINGYSKINTFYRTPEIEIHLGKSSRLEIEKSE